MYNVRGIFLGSVSLGLFTITLLAAVILGLSAYSVGVILFASAVSFGVSVWQESSGRLQKKPRDWQRIKVKIFGLLVYFLFFVLLLKCLSLVSEPHRMFLSDYFFYILLGLIFFVFYFVYCDKFASLNNDEWVALGVGVVRANFSKVLPAAKGLILKSFFLPLMFLWLDVSLVKFMEGGFGRLLTSATFITEFILLGTIFDLYIGFLGYIFVSRLTGAEMKVDNGWRSWLFCLACYPPLYSVVQLVLKPSDDIYWNDFFLDGGISFYVWGFSLVTLWVIYWWATLSFGLRFSNLSYRGLVDRGPYKYLKHPAYASKVCYWWLLSVPFVSPLGFWGVIQNFVCLAGVSWIYFMRAREEERFLSGFPEYREYQDRVKATGLRARVNSLKILIS
ncbi:methyltransferase family protein [Microbulbifer sp. PSTR4-B]|uniref:methyltransferase family protein n=1 Tax=Microbulbifer sp. PSTR4-B TaxID=3243396 RepID=UPI0040399361